MLDADLDRDARRRFAGWARSSDNLLDRLRAQHPTGDPHSKARLLLAPPPAPEKKPDVAAAIVSGPPVDLPAPEPVVLEPEDPEPEMPGFECIRIKRAVARHFKLTVPDLISVKRNNRYTRARHVGMHLTKVMLNISLPEIGRRFGGRDHTTVLHGLRKVESRMADFQDDIDAVKKLLGIPPAQTGENHGTGRE